jgi:hypothetical protein
MGTGCWISKAALSPARSRQLLCHARKVQSPKLNVVIRKQHLRIKVFFGPSENAVKSQIWIAMSVYVLVAMVKEATQLSASPYEMLQILSLTMFERIPLDQLLADIVTDDIQATSANAGDERGGMMSPLTVTAPQQDAFQGPHTASLKFHMRRDVFEPRRISPRIRRYESRRLRKA